MNERNPFGLVWVWRRLAAGAVLLALLGLYEACRALLQ